MQSDYELLLLIAEGDERAFELFFSRYRDKLYQYLLLVTKSSEIAEEITMDIFLKLWAGRELLTQITEPGAFLRKIAHNKAIDFFRVAARHDKLHKAYAAHIQRLHENDDQSTLDEESLQLLREIINQLPPRRKQIYLLSREHNMTYDQIAKHLNISHKTVKNSMLSALNEIRQHLAKKSGNTSLLWLFFSC
ncbi:MAG: RNA polymerase sigma factor [Chitinophagaceae bacterium]